MIGRKSVQLKLSVSELTSHALGNKNLEKLYYLIKSFKLVRLDKSHWPVTYWQEETTAAPPATKQERQQKGGRGKGNNTGSRKEYGQRKEGDFFHSFTNKKLTLLHNLYIYNISHVCFAYFISFSHLKHVWYISSNHKIEHNPCYKILLSRFSLFIFCSRNWWASQFQTRTKKPLSSCK